MVLFISDDEYEQSFQTKQKDKTKVSVKQKKEVAPTYGDYCTCDLLRSSSDYKVEAT